MEFQDVMALRRSTRAYTEEKVSSEDLEKVLEAAQRAPIGHHNFGGYLLTVIEKPEVLALMRETFTRVSGAAEDPSYGAPMFIMVSATPEANDTVVKYDAAVIIENMHLAATELGLGSCYIHGMIRTIRHEADWKKAAGIPEEATPMCGLILGHAKMPFRKRPMKENLKVTVCR